MIPVILEKRQAKVLGGQVFNKLIAYINGGAKQEQLQARSQEQKFDDLLNYTTKRLAGQRGQEKCIAIRTHGVADISSASIEMNAVSARNIRCEDPAFHFILAWPEHERPHPDAIFDAAEHAIKSLGLVDHQYVLAVHADTDNLHCHAAVNRIHPITFKSRNVEWANRTIHMAARQSEIKHGWTHENGIYIVKIDDQNKKIIILNPVHDHTKHSSRYIEEINKVLPAWHDPDSLDSWLKSKVAKSLKLALPNLTSWHALHAWLAKIDITLSDTGGGGMRLHFTSVDTGEVVDLPVSKCLRILKRDELETRWGKFAYARTIHYNTPDISSLSHSQIAKGVDRVLKASFDRGIPPPHILRENELRKIQSTNTISKPVTDLIVSQKNLLRDNSKRMARLDQRAEARSDLRRRFSQYRRFVRDGDVDYIKRKSELRAERRQSLKLLFKKTEASELASRLTWPITVKGSLFKMAEVFLEASRQKIEMETSFQEKFKSLRATRTPPLVWREWLYEQANLGDQAAISALRGIVYQAHRDAKHGHMNALVPTEKEDDHYESSEQQFLKAMARLLEDEQKEVAIRSARIDAMRPYEADALLVKHVGMLWYVSGNGNVVYNDQNGEHIFTDRGNRVTFDRVFVSDEDIHLALIHAQLKFGNQLILTGNSPVFTARMACMADDMGITILNPELQTVIVNHRNERLINMADAQRTAPTLFDPSQSDNAVSKANNSDKQIYLQPEPGSTNKDAIAAEGSELQISQERLRDMVLSIDPRAEFIIPVISDTKATYRGPVAAAFTTLDSAQCFAQHLGRSIYALHPANPPENHNDASIDVQYRDGLVVTTATEKGNGKGKTR